MAFSKASAKQKWNAEHRRYERAQEELLRLLNLLIEDLSSRYEIRPVPLVTGKLKEFDSFYDKACSYQEEGRVSTTSDCFKKIKDIARARVVCQTLDDAQGLNRMINDSEDFNVLDVQEHDGSDTGYRG